MSPRHHAERSCRHPRRRSPRGVTMTASSAPLTLRLGAQPQHGLEIRTLTRRRRARVRGPRWVATTTDERPLGSGRGAQPELDAVSVAWRQVDPGKPGRRRGGSPRSPRPRTRRLEPQCRRADGLEEALAVQVDREDATVQAPATSRRPEPSARPPRSSRSAAAGRQTSAAERHPPARCSSADLAAPRRYAGGVVRAHALSVWRRRRRSPRALHACRLIGGIRCRPPAGLRPESRVLRHTGYP